MTNAPKSWESTFKEMILKENPAGNDSGIQKLSLDGDSRIYICRLWDGVYLWANEVRSHRIAAFDFKQRNYAVLNVCHAGRCEVEMQDDTYVYMTPGFLDINNREPKCGYTYPGGFYEGIEIAFDLDILKECVPGGLSSFGLDVETLELYLEKGGGNYMAQVSERAMQQGTALYEGLKKGKLSIADYRFLAVSLLYHLKNGEAEEISNRSMVTKGQRRIAVEVEQILTKDYKRHYTVGELAEGYGVSPSALKKYFEAVFGKPISHYMRDKRMNQAKTLLAHTDASIGETAVSCGYEHQGKFGAAFKAYTGVSPLEYRRLNSSKKEQKEERP